MPLKVPSGLPALQAVKNEGVPVEEFVSSTGATLHIALLNIMPTKETTEADFIRVLSEVPYDIELTLMKLDTHTPKHASPEYMQRYYKGFSELRNRRFDGLIITGAPVEHIEFEEVTYWEEICEIIDWAKSNVTSTLFICWAAQAGVYHKFGIQKHLLPKKMFGIFGHDILTPEEPLFTGMGDSFPVPHSRHTTLLHDEIADEPRLQLLTKSQVSGVHIIKERGTSNFFITGHSEYAVNTLDTEYRRDLAKGFSIEAPVNYYTDNDPSLQPVNSWQRDARKMFGNWVQYYLKDKNSK